MATWLIDPAHSEIGFKVKHLVISTVSGKFTSFDGKVEGDIENFEKATINFSADIDSINTGVEQRDGHLKSPDFFDAASHPKLTFQSNKIKSEGGEDYTVEGNLTIRGVTKPVTLKAEFGGIQTSLYGQTVAGFEVTTKINRQDYGLTWSDVTEAGGIVVADEVKFIANVELIKQ